MAADTWFISVAPNSRTENKSGWRISGPWIRTEAMPFSTESSGFDSLSGSFRRASKNATAWVAMACMASVVMSQG